MNSVNCKLFIRPTEKSEMLKWLVLGALAFVWYFIIFQIKIMRCYKYWFHKFNYLLGQVVDSQFQNCGISLWWSIQKNTFGDEYPISEIDLCVSLATLLLPQALESVSQQNIILLLAMYKLNHSVALTVYASIVQNKLHVSQVLQCHCNPL